MARKIKLTPIGTTVLTVAVGVCVGSAGQTVVDRLMASPRTGKTLKWEVLEGEDGPWALRSRTPDGWLVCLDEDPYLVSVSDSEHVWLDDGDD